MSGRALGSYQFRWLPRICTISKLDHTRVDPQQAWFYSRKFIRRQREWLVGSVDARLDDLGLRLPPAPQAPSGITLPFQWVRIHGDRAFASGHGALSDDGTIASPVGQVPTEVPVEQAQLAAVGALLSMLSTLREALGDLDRITAWLTLSGYVNAASDFAGTTLVVNPASELLLSVFGPETGAHARTAVGHTTVPFRMPVVLSAELSVRPQPVVGMLWP